MENNMKQLFLYISKTQAALSQLNNEQAGRLLRRLVAYVAGNDTETGDPLVDALFAMFKVDIDEGADRYGHIIEKRRAAGRNHSGNQYTRKNGTSVPNLEQNGTNGTNGTKDKDKDKDKDMTTLLTSNSVVVIDAAATKKSLHDFVESLQNDGLWVEQVCIRHHIKPDELNANLSDFEISCAARGCDKHVNDADVKKHFDSWLTIRKEIERKELKNGNNDKSNIERMFGIRLDGKDVFGGN